MLVTPNELLCQPLMMQESAVLQLVDETVRSMLSTGSGARPQASLSREDHPAVSVALYTSDGEQVLPEVTTDPETGEQRMGEVDTEGREPNTLIAVVPLSGVMTRHGYRGWFYSRPGTVDIGRELKKLDRDPAVHSIILQVNSPGGSVTGTPEFSELIYGIREAGNTEVLAVVDDLMASAATYVATAAGRVYSIPSAYSGSVGTIIGYTSYHKALQEAGIEVEYLRTPEKKARFTGVEPMDDDMRDTLRQRIEQSQAWFIRDMARNRGVSESHVQKHFGQGEVMRADEALSGGLIDEIASLDDCVMMQAAKIRKGQSANRRRAAQQRLDAALAEQQELTAEVSGESSSTAEKLDRLFIGGGKHGEVIPVRSDLTTLVMPSSRGNQYGDDQYELKTMTHSDGSTEDVFALASLTDDALQKLYQESLDPETSEV